MLSKVTLNHKMVELNSFSSKQLLETYLKSKFPKYKYTIAFFLKYKITG